MTIEEIERTLQTVAENQAQLTADVQKLTGANRILEEASALHQQVLRNHEARQAGLEESFRKLVELASTADSRLDAVEGSQVHTDSRLDALIDSQIQLTQRFDQMVGRVDMTSSHLNQLTQRFDQMVGRVDMTSSHLDQLTQRFDQI